MATKLMQRALEIAKEKRLREVWVGTETDNDIAKVFYASLDPYEVEPSIIYSYKAIT